jgi:hypothetical protein
MLYNRALELTAPIYLKLFLLKKVPFPHNLGYGLALKCPPEAHMLNAWLFPVGLLENGGTIKK